MGNQRRFGNVATRPINPEEATQADVDRLINELYDLYNIPGDTPYRGSIYEQMDMIIVGAYDYYDNDSNDETSAFLLITGSGSQCLQWKARVTGKCRIT